MAQKKNKQFITRIIQVAIGLSAGVIICIWLFNQVSYTDLIREISDLNWIGVTVCAIAQFITLLLRSVRWRWLLIAAKARIPLLFVFNALCSGYLMNFIFPRAGEVFRCMILQKSRQVPQALAFGTVVSERLIDLLCIGICVLLALLVEFNYINTHIQQTAYGLAHNIYVWIGLGVLVVLGILYFPYRKQLQQHIIGRNIKRLLHQVWQGIISIRHLEGVPSFIGLTVLIWVWYYISCYALIMSHPLGSTVPWQASLVILALSSIGAIAPIQGGIGIFHGIVAYILIHYGLSSSAALGIALVLHGIFTLLSISLGAWGCIAFFFFKGKTRGSNHN